MSEAACFSSTCGHALLQATMLCYNNRYSAKTPQPITEIFLDRREKRHFPAMYLHAISFDLHRYQVKEQLNLRVTCFPSKAYK